MNFRQVLRPTLCALLLVGIALWSGCVSRAVTVRGECLDARGRPRADVAISHVDLHASFPKPTLVEKSGTQTDDRGRFSISFETRRSWMLKFAWGSRQIGSYVSLSPPPDLRDADEVLVTVKIGGESGIDCQWRKKPNKAPEPTP